MSGDEYYHRPHDANGFTIIPDPATGWYVYADLAGMDLVPTGYIPGRDDPAARGLRPNLKPDASLLTRNITLFRGADGDFYGRAPHSGVVNSVCVFIRFSDQAEFGEAVSTYDNIYNSAVSASMRGFFLEESNNQLDVSTTYYPSPAGMVMSYQDSWPRAYYTPQTPTNPIGYPQPGGSWDHTVGYQRLHTMLHQATIYIAPMVPPGINVDTDGDGSMDNISFVCRGPADATGIIWPHAWVMDALFPVPPNAYINGAMPDEYNFEPQLNDPSYGGGGIDVAIVCHEFSHTLGFPDMYHYIGDGIDPCGGWDLMDYCLGTPQHHLAYTKMKYGQWYQPSEVQALPAMGSGTLTAVSGGDPFDCYMYQMPTGEQVWFEYRRNIGTYESALPGTGLLIYRVNPAMTGNAYVNDPLYPGLLDEVYVYRPYVTPGFPNGAIHLAHYAWEVMRTAINASTDPAPFSASNPGFNAPISIHSIGSNGSTSITFEIMPAGSPVPVIWTGKTDNNWLNPGNWTTLAVPTATDFVIIGQDPYMGVPCTVPLSAGMGAMCGNLRVEYNLTLFPGATLQVAGHMHSIGWIVNQANLIQVTGDLKIKERTNLAPPPSFVTQGNPMAQVIVGGHCLFDSGTSVNFTMGQLIFSNIGVSPPVNYFTVDTPGVVLNDVIVNKTNCALAYNSIKIFALPLTVRGVMQVTANSTFTVNSPQDIMLDGNLQVAPTGQLHWDLGRLILTGNPGPQSTIIANPMSHLNHLDINCGTGLNTNLAGNLEIRGNLTINQGCLAANTFTIRLYGNWLNNVGPTGFQKGSSRVILCGSGNQSIQVSAVPGPMQENFHILELAQTGRDPSALVLNTPGQMVLCDVYDYTSGSLSISEGTFQAQALFDSPALLGKFLISDNGNASFSDPAANIDIGADITIHSGMLNVTNSGPNTGMMCSWGMLPATLGMDGGVLQFPFSGIGVLPAGGVVSMDISGGQIMAAGDLLIQTADFDPSGGMLTLTDPPTPGINQICAINGGWVYALELACSHASTVGDLQINQMLNVHPICTLDVGHAVSVTGNTTIQGILNLNNTASLATAGLNTNGTVNVYHGATLSCASEVFVEGLGSLNCLGQAGDDAILTGSGRGFWRLRVEGAISAAHASFTKLQQDGIHIYPSASVDLTADFDHCSFSEPDPSGCTFLTIDNAQTLSIDAISFVSNGEEVTNISKTQNSGSVSITSCCGDAAGPQYELDPHALIYWAGFDRNLIVESITVSDPDPYIADMVDITVVVKNSGTDPTPGAVNVHLFKHRADPPDWDETGDLSLECPVLNGGDTHSCVFEDLYSMYAMDWLAWALIDPEKILWETDEQDNRASTSLSWHALPVVGSVGIAITGSSQARLSWQYPIWASRFNLYYCDDPYGAYGYLGTTTNTYWDLSPSEDHLFFQIMAERDDPFPSK